MKGLGDTCICTILLQTPLPSGCPMTLCRVLRVPHSRSVFLIHCEYLGVHTFIPNSFPHPSPQQPWVPSLRVSCYVVRCNCGFRLSSVLQMYYRCTIHTWMGNTDSESVELYLGRPLASRFTVLLTSRWRVCLVAQSRPTPYDSMGCSPPGSLCSWNSPGKNTGVGSYSILQEIFPS